MLSSIFAPSIACILWYTFRMLLLPYNVPVGASSIRVSKFERTCSEGEQSICQFLSPSVAAKSWGLQMQNSCCRRGRCLCSQFLFPLSEAQKMNVHDTRPVTSFGFSPFRFTSSEVLAILGFSIGLSENARDWERKFERAPWQDLALHQTQTHPTPGNTWKYQYIPIYTW